MILSNILKIDPFANPESATQVAEIWNEVVDAILKLMFEYSSAHMNTIHINLREEMCLELVELRACISHKVVEDRMSGRSVAEIDVLLERQLCFDESGITKISNTAKNCAEIWVKKYQERWAPKTIAALEKESSKKIQKITPKCVDKNHFIPLSFIKRYWAEEQYVFKNVKDLNGGFDCKRIPVGSWGFSRGLYSDFLEAYFGLIEGDAVKPIQMLLNVEPLNKPQREAFLGFVIIQRLRNPHLIKSLRLSMVPVIAAEVGGGKEYDDEYMRAVYETLYSQNEFYDQMARPILFSRWTIIKSEDPVFVLPDVCNIYGIYEENPFVIMPLTPNVCFIALPIQEPEIRIVPYYVKAESSLALDIASFLIRGAVSEFLGSSRIEERILINDDVNALLERIFFSINELVSKKQQYIL